jgi:hypothetical protein
MISRPLNRHRKIRMVVEGVQSRLIIALLAVQWQLATDTFDAARTTRN